MNLYGQDMDETVTPLVSGLGWTVDLASPREFVGKRALEASTPDRQLTGLLLQEKGGVLRAHQRVHAWSRRFITASATARWNFPPTRRGSSGR